MRAIVSHFHSPAAYAIFLLLVESILGCFPLRQGSSTSGFSINNFKEKKRTGEIRKNIEGQTQIGCAVPSSH